MFSKAKSKDKDGNTNDAARLSGAAEASPSASQTKRSNGSRPSSSLPKATVPSIISQDVVISGAIRAAGEVQLDGTLEGDVEAAALIVGDKAVVKGEIVCEKITVRGRVEGGIRARQVTLASTAYIDGDILHAALSVETGAYFEGNCRHYDDPLSDAAAKEFSKAKKANGANFAPAPKQATSDENAKASLRPVEKTGAAFPQKAQLR